MNSSICNSTELDERINALNRLRELILALERAEGTWVVPWTGRFGRSPQRNFLMQTYVEQFQQQVLDRLDPPLRQRIVDLQGAGTSDLAGGLIRRINMLNAVLAENSPEDVPGVEVDYLFRADPEFKGESAELFNALYTAYLNWHRRAAHARLKSSTSCRRHSSSSSRAIAVTTPG